MDDINLLSNPLFAGARIIAIEGWENFSHAEKVAACEEKIEFA